MKTTASVLMSACLALASGSVFAAAHAEKKMTADECKAHMAAQKSGAKKDDAMMKKDAMCADMMKAASAPKK